MLITAVLCYRKRKMVREEDNDYLIYTNVTNLIDRYDPKTLHQRHLTDTLGIEQKNPYYVHTTNKKKDNPMLSSFTKECKSKKFMPVFEELEMDTRNIETTENINYRHLELQTLTQ